jgi:membrane protease YdiL (CAAX protease family)
MGTDVSSTDWQLHLQTVSTVIGIVAGAYLAAVLTVSIGASVLQSLGVGLADPASRAIRSALQFVGFGVAVAAYLQLRDDWELIRWRVPTLRDLGWMVGGLVTLFGTLYVLSVVASLLGASTAESQIVANGRENPVYLLYLVPVTIFLVGPTEELIFRGIVQGTIRRAYGPIVGVLGASVVFASIHLPSLLGDGQFTTLGIIFALGALLGILYEVTDNIVVPIVVHGLFNAAQFVSQYASQTGML